MTSRRSREDGSAMIMSLLMVMGLSVVGASLSVLSLSETYGSMNYRLMSQARYGAESGVQVAANYLLNTYAVPGSVADPLNAYDMTKSPVLRNNQPVVLSSFPGVASNYPVAAVQTAFQNAVAGSLVAGNANIQYAAYATLMSMRTVDVYGNPVPVVIQTWQITGDGATSGARNAEVQVTATLERQTVGVFNYAAFSASGGCGALTFSGGAVIDSYDSQNIVMQNGSVVTQQFGGNIGSNGNLNESGGATVYGTMSTPKGGVGNCAAGGVSAWSASGGAQVTGGLIQLPQTLAYPSPAAPNPLPPTTNLNIGAGTTCVGIAGCSPGNPNGLKFAPGTFGNISVGGGAKLHLGAGTYVINSLNLSGGSSLVIDSGPVVLNVAGQSQATPVNFSGGAVANSTFDPAMLQIQYAGAGTISLSGGATSAGIVYAPNAAANLSGGVDWFGSIISATMNASGGMHIHNDRQLANEFFTVGNFMLSSFSWKKY